MTRTHQRASVVSEAYCARVRSGQLIDDPNQRAVLPVFDRLATICFQSNPPSLSLSLSHDQKHRRSSKSSSLDSEHQGIYLSGPVGCGKTKIMDLFVETILSSCADNSNLSRVRRQHYHPFMLDMHSEMEVWRKRSRRGLKVPSDVATATGEQLAKITPLLCIDEFSVHHISDAMVLERLMSSFFTHNGTLVTTSNYPICNLYLNGLNRDRFLPFLDQLSKYCSEVSLNSSTDYRLETTDDRTRWFSPIDAPARLAFERAWSKATGGALAQKAVIVLPRRQLHVGERSGRNLRTTFRLICGQVAGGADFRSICEQFDWIFMADVPDLSGQSPDQLKRFISFIDAVTDANKSMVTLAESKPMELGSGNEPNQQLLRLISRLVALSSGE